MTDGIELTFAEGIATVTLARSDKLNALDEPLIAALSRAADAIDAEPGVRAAILTGTGTFFCAGGDIKAWAVLHALDMGQSWIRNGHRCFDKLARLKVPLIAALNGPALGGGLELAATADFRIAEPSTRVGLPETAIGTVPGWSGTERLVVRFGSQVVRRMALAGDIFSADQALRLGIVDEVAGAGGSLVGARQWATRIARRAPAATTIAKQLINAAENEDASATIGILAAALASSTEDIREGATAFREKRPPDFKGR